MLQIDHVYELLYQELFKDFLVFYFVDGVAKPEPINHHDVRVFTPCVPVYEKMFFYDQEPYIPNLVDPYIKVFKSEPTNRILVTSEISPALDSCARENDLLLMYYFFHGFAALDWYRGYYALYYNRPVVQSYNKDFISYNRLISEDRSYRIYFISLLKESGLLDRGTVSFNVADNNNLTWRDELQNANCKLSDNSKLHIEKNLIGIDRLVVDCHSVHGSASADIPRTAKTWLNPDNPLPPDVSAFWHIVTETVFYYDKLHLTEKIFKPIVSKQPFMLLAAPGNLNYLRRYGFKTFGDIIDESYDDIEDNDTRTKAVVEQLEWYCNLSESDKAEVMTKIEPIVEYNFHHFYNDFKYIITDELINNTKKIFKDIGYDDKNIDYNALHHILTK